MSSLYPDILYTSTSSAGAPSSDGILTTQPTTVITPAKSDLAPAAPPYRDYSKQISQAQEFHQRAAVVYSLMAENRVYALFNDAYVQINEAYERFDTDKSEHTREELLELFSTFFNAAKFSNSQKDLMTAAIEIAESIIEYYDDQVFTIFSGKPFETLSSKYRLNADLRASQLSKISAIVTSHFATVIAEMRDIEQRRNWLQSNYQAFVTATNDEFDWGNAARNFGAGALAVAHPIIGIPALIANFKHQSDKQKTERAQLDRYVELFDEFENKVQSVRQQIIQAAEQTKRYVGDKFKEVNGSAIAAILSETAASGCILDHYFKSLDFKELENVERKLLSEGT
jgi:flagellar biosynthesis/type III secretory pathway protein FliH